MKIPFTFGQIFSFILQDITSIHVSYAYLLSGICDGSPATGNSMDDSYVDDDKIKTI